MITHTVKVTFAEGEFNHSHSMIFVLKDMENDADALQWVASMLQVMGFIRPNQYELEIVPNA